MFAAGHLQLVTLWRKLGFKGKHASLRRQRWPWRNWFSSLRNMEISWLEVDLNMTTLEMKTSSVCPGLLMLQSQVLHQIYSIFEWAVLQISKLTVLAAEIYGRKTGLKKKHVSCVDSLSQWVLWAILAAANFGWERCAKAHLWRSKHFCSLNH